MSNLEVRDFDLIIFGATGAVGAYAILELYQSLASQPTEYGHLRWAIAGRSLSKLQQTLARLSSELSVDLTSIPKLEADITNLYSISALTKRTKVLLNFVGPYRQYGRPVLEACLASQTHHIDPSAELQYIEGAQVDFHARALESETLLISTCGFCSIIPEMGVALARSAFQNGTIHSVETFVDLKPGPGVGYTANMGSFTSILYTFVHIRELIPIRRQLQSQFFSPTKPQSRITVHRWPIKFPCSSNSPGVSVILPLPDHSATSRTCEYNWTTFQERPIHYSAYYRLRMLKVLCGWPIFCLFWCKCGRSLLKRHLDCLTAGLISKEGPNKAQVDAARFSLRVVAQGWKSHIPVKSANQYEPSEPRDAKVELKLSGPDPEYVVTAACMVQAGLTVLMDGQKMPKGGVLTPGSAFRSTRLWDRLQNRGIKVERLKNNLPTEKERFIIETQL